VKISKLQTAASIAVFMTAGLLSSWIVYQNDKSILPFVWPGVIFAGAALMAGLILNRQLSVTRMLLYWIFLNLLYLIIFWFTFISGGGGFLVGIATSAVGAMGVAILTHRYLVPARFNFVIMAIIGALCFVLVDLWITYYNVYLDKESTKTIEDALPVWFAPLYAIWQPVVGIQLVIAIKKFLLTHKDRTFIPG
jgi:hypothetical protein